MSDPPAAGPAAPAPPAQGPQPGGPSGPDKAPAAKADAPKASVPDGGAPSTPDAGAGAGAGAGSAAEPESFAVKPGEAAAKATSRYGEGSQRGQYLREAGGWSIDGDFVSGGKEFVAGDKNVYMATGERGPRPCKPLPARLTHVIKGAFVPPAGLSEVQAAHEKRRAVVLRGVDGCGKLGLAIHLLEPCTKLCQVDRSADLTSLREWIEAGDDGHRGIELGAGYILDDPSDVAHLHGSALQGLEEDLDQADARLILLIRAEVMVADELHDYVIDVAGPDYEKILESHLGFYIGPENAVKLLARADVQDFAREELGSNATCRLAAELAAELADEVRATKNPDDVDISRIRTAWLRRRDETFDRWFSELDDTQSRCYAIALAVLNELPYDTVAKAARALYRRFDTRPYAVMVSASDPPPDGQRPFLRSRQDWLRCLQARIEERERDGDYGQSLAETIEYKDERYRQRVIERAWSDYQAQDALLDWLREIAQDDSVPVRIGAGKALGLLVLHSFDHLSLNVLEAWAVGPALQRETVAYALGAVADDLRLHKNLRRLVSGWYTDTARPLAQATAARAYGLVRGAFDRHEAFVALEKLATVDDIRVAIAVGKAISDLLDDGPPDFACRVMATLARSLDDRQKSVTVQLVFLIVANDLVTTVRTEGQAEETSWPVLLHLVAGQPSVRMALVRLWKYVLNGAQFVDEAAQVMTAWATATESDPQMREAFLRLVRAVAAGDDRTQMIFARYVALWTSDDNFSPIPQTSAAVQAILDAERTPR